MPAPESRLLSFRACACLSSLLAALAPTVSSVGGCSLLIDGQLSAKPDAARGAGGQDGEGGHADINASSSSSQGSGGFAGLMCQDGFADCDGNASNGCEAHVKDDPKHCGACDHLCQSGEKCTEGACK